MVYLLDLKGHLISAVVLCSSFTGIHPFPFNRNFYDNESHADELVTCSEPCIFILRRGILKYIGVMDHGVSHLLSNG